MGGRFHGNVISLWNNIKSLFIVTDSRTRELTSHFMLPTIMMEDFDKEKDVKYYFDLADYTNFNREYANRFREFTEFLKMNGIFIPDKVSVLKFANTNEEKPMYEKTILQADNQNILSDKKTEFTVPVSNSRKEVIIIEPFEEGIEKIESRRDGKSHVKQMSAWAANDTFDYVSTGRYSLAYGNTEMRTCHIWIML